MFINVHGRIHRIELIEMPRYRIEFAPGDVRYPNRHIPAGLLEFGDVVLDNTAQYRAVRIEEREARANPVNNGEKF